MLTELIKNIESLENVKDYSDENWVIFAITTDYSIKVLSYCYNNPAFQEFKDEYISEAEYGTIIDNLYHLSGKVFKSFWDNDFSSDYFGEISGGFFISLDEKHLVELYDFNKK